MPFSDFSSLQKRWQAGLLAMTMLLMSPMTVVAKSTRIEKISQPAIEEAANKGLFDDIVNVITGGNDNICLPFLGCIDVGQVTETLVMEQLKQMLTKDNAPIAVDADDVYPVSLHLSGVTFNQPQLLDLTLVQPDTVIPPGDYLIPVMGICLEQTFSSPNGHRYRLAPMGGTHQTVLADFLATTATQGLDYQTIQGVTWGIRSGMRLNDMPTELQTVIRHAVPQHQKSLDNSSFLSDVRDIGSQVVQFLGYSSFENFLRTQEEWGALVSEVLTIEDSLTHNNDWRSLSSRFLNESNSPIGNIEQTPWSQIAPGIHARFVTTGNAGDVGTLLLRVEASQTTAANKHQVGSRSKNLPDYSAPNGLTGADLHGMLGSTVAVPEGSGRVQPLALQPYAIGDLPTNPDGTVQVAALPAAAAIPWAAEATAAGAVVLYDFLCRLSSYCTSPSEALENAIRGDRNQMTVVEDPTPQTLTTPIPEQQPQLESIPVHEPELQVETLPVQEQVPDIEGFDIDESANQPSILYDAPADHVDNSMFPAGESQLGHIFGDRDGHIPDTPENRDRILNTVNNPDNYVGTSSDQGGKHTYAEIQPDGTQVWGSVIDGVIQNGGVNQPGQHRQWNPETERFEKQ